MAKDSDSNTIPLRPSNVGILAMDVYFPTRVVNQSDLEKFNNVSTGKYTKGLGQKGMGFVDDREDLNSVCLTVVSSLLRRYDVLPSDIGRIEVGTESLVDKSKSPKTVLMQLFGNNTDVEGVTSVNACYGGAAALFNSVAWVQSEEWDGRLALVVAADIAVYADGPARPTGGVGAVAFLVGPDAPLAMEARTRTSYAADTYDFYKPNMSSEYPIVDGKLSQTCYLRALDYCYVGFSRKSQTSRSLTGLPVNDVDGELSTIDYSVFHAPYNKLVVKSFSRLYFHDYHKKTDNSNNEYDKELLPWKNVTLSETYTDRPLDLILRKLSFPTFTEKVQPSTLLPCSIGNCYTASVFAGILSLISTKGKLLHGKRISVFSYGSGAIATMFALRGRKTKSNRYSLELIKNKVGLIQRLNDRKIVHPEEFKNALKMREMTKSALLSTVTKGEIWHPQGSVDNIVPGGYYLVSIDSKQRRSYSSKCIETASTVNVACSIANTARHSPHEENEIQEFSKHKKSSSSQSSQSFKSIPSIDLPSSAERNNNKNKTFVEGRKSKHIPLAVLGTSIGLPCPKGRRVFDSQNKNRMFSGECLVTVLPTENLKNQLDRKITKLVRQKNATHLISLNREDQCMRLAGRCEGTLDLVTDYGMSPSLVSTMDSACKLAVAAGLEALLDAGLVCRQRAPSPMIVGRTHANSPGAGGAHDWKLPIELRDRTGVVCAASFAFLESVVKEETSYRQSLRESANDENNDEFDIPRFDRKYLFSILNGGAVQLAQACAARGPNTQIMAACAGTTQALSIAQDWITNDRCDRVIVVAGDDACNDTLLPHVASGFLAVGAACTSGKPENGLLPYDVRRNGMLLGSGAVGIVLERTHSLPNIQIEEKQSQCLLLATQISNSAFHGARLSADHVASELDRFLLCIEKNHGITKKNLVDDAVYIGHETGTDGLGNPLISCGGVEAAALRKAFGPKLFPLLRVCATKGQTGHAMGVAFEDVIATCILNNRDCLGSNKKRNIPPVVNHSTLDPSLGPLHVMTVDSIENDAKRGRSHPKYAIRFAAGFGSQLAFALFGQ